MSHLSHFYSYKTAKKRIEKMWGKYHNLRISSSYIEMWEKIVKEAGVSDPTPTFYQHTGHTVFKEVVKIRHPLNTSSSQMAPQPPTVMMSNIIDTIIICVPIKCHLCRSERHQRIINGCHLMVRAFFCEAALIQLLFPE